MPAWSKKQGKPIRAPEAGPAVNCSCCGKPGDVRCPCGGAAGGSAPRTVQARLSGWQGKANFNDTYSWGALSISGTWCLQNPPAFDVQLPPGVPFPLGSCFWGGCVKGGVGVSYSRIGSSDPPTSVSGDLYVVFEMLIPVAGNGIGWGVRSWVHVPIVDANGVDRGFDIAGPGTSQDFTRDKACTDSFERPIFESDDGGVTHHTNGTWTVTSSTKDCTPNICATPCPTDCAVCCKTLKITLRGTNCKGLDGVPLIYTRVGTDPGTDGCLYSSPTVGAGGTLQCLFGAWLLQQFLPAECGGFQIRPSGKPPFPGLLGCPTEVTDWGERQTGISVTVECADLQCATDCSKCAVITGAISISQTGVGVNGWDATMQTDGGGTCPLNASDGQLGATLECPSRKKWRLTTFQVSDPGIHIVYEEDPQPDGCPPDVFTHVTENTVPGSGGSPVATIDGGGGGGAGGAGFLWGIF